MELDDELKEPEINKLTDNAEGTLPNATAVLVLGILSIATCVAWGIIGLVCGIIALSIYPKDRRMFESNPKYYAESYKSSRAGYICAIIGVSLSAIMLFLMIASLATNNFGQGFYR